MAFEFGRKGILLLPRFQKKIFLRYRLTLKKSSPSKKYFSFYFR